MNRGRPTFRTYQIRRSGTAGNMSFALSLPRQMAEMVPRDQHFKPEFTDDGILYRAVSPEDAEPDLPKPKWLGATG